MIITVELTNEERQAIRGMTQKRVINSAIKEMRKVITPTGRDAVEIKPALVITTAKLIAFAAPLIVGTIAMLKSVGEAIKPFVKAVEDASKTEEEG